MYLVYEKLSKNKKGPRSADEIALDLQVYGKTVQKELDNIRDTSEVLDVNEENLENTLDDHIESVEEIHTQEINTKISNLIEDEIQKYKKGESPQDDIKLEELASGSLYRFQLKKAKAYVIEEALRKAQKTLPKNERKIVAERLKKLKKPKVEETVLTKKFNDASGYSIGRSYICDKVSDDLDSITISDTKYIRGIDLKVTEKENSMNSDYAIRFVAYLTPKGLSKLKKYLKKRAKKKNRTTSETSVYRKKGVKQYDKKEKRASSNGINKYLKQNNTVNFEIGKVNVHANFQGKIEVFLDYSNTKNIMDNHIKKTNKKLTQRIFMGFKMLANALGGIYKLDDH